MDGPGPGIWDAGEVGRDHMTTLGQKPHMHLTGPSESMETEAAEVR